MMELPLLARHPLSPALKPFIVDQTYDRDGGHRNPRHRFEVRAPRELLPVFATIVVKCAGGKCASPPLDIHPVRVRKGWGTAFVSVTCELDTCKACARSRAARDEYLRLRAWLLGAA